MKRLLILLLLLPFVYSLPELIIEPESDSVDVYQHGNESFNLTLYNYGDNDIINLTFTGISGVSFPSVPFIARANITEILNASNETVNITVPTSYNYTYHVMTDSIFNSIFATTLSFSYYSYVNANPASYNITVNNAGFSPSTLSIHQQDTIKVTNTGNETHSFTFLNGTGYTIPAGSYASVTFTKTEVLNYYDTVTGHSGRINITNRSILTSLHNTDLDRAFQLSINSRPQEAMVDGDIFIGSVTMDYSGSAVNVINIINNGNQTAYSVNLTANWTGFSENGFNLSPYSTRLVNFNITPENITTSEQTGIAYTITISIAGLNFDTVEKNLTVNIRKNNFSASSVTEINATTFVWISQEHIKALCDAQPELCPTYNNTVIEYVEIPATIDGVDADTVKELNDKFDRQGVWQTQQGAEHAQDISDIEGYVQDGNREIYSYGDKIENLSETQASNMNTTKTEIGALKDELIRTRNNTTVAVIFIVFLVMLAVLGLRGDAILDYTKKLKRRSKKSFGWDY